MMVDNNDEGCHISLEKEVKAQIFEESSEVMWVIKVRSNNEDEEPTNIHSKRCCLDLCAYSSVFVLGPFFTCKYIHYILHTIRYKSHAFTCSPTTGRVRRQWKQTAGCDGGPPARKVIPSGTCWTPVRENYRILLTKTRKYTNKNIVLEGISNSLALKTQRARPSPYISVRVHE